MSSLLPKSVKERVRNSLRLLLLKRIFLGHHSRYPKLLQSDEQRPRLLLLSRRDQRGYQEVERGLGQSSEISGWRVIVMKSMMRRMRTNHHTSDLSLSLDGNKIIKIHQSTGRLLEPGLFHLSLVLDLMVLRETIFRLTRIDTTPQAAKDHNLDPLIPREIHIWTIECPCPHLDRSTMLKSDLDKAVPRHQEVTPTNKTVKQSGMPILPLITGCTRTNPESLSKWKILLHNSRNRSLHMVYSRLDCRIGRIGQQRDKRNWLGRQERV
jgi:hypothetical protein